MANHVPSLRPTHTHLQTHTFTRSCTNIYTYTLTHKHMHTYSILPRLRPNQVYFIPFLLISYYFLLPSIHTHSNFYYALRRTPISLTLSPAFRPNRWVSVPMDAWWWLWFHLYWVNASQTSVALLILSYSNFQKSTTTVPVSKFRSSGRPGRWLSGYCLQPKSQVTIVNWKS